MKTIGVFFQREGSRQIDDVEIEAVATVSELMVKLVAKGIPPDALLFLEDESEPLVGTATLEKLAGHRKVLKVHAHRCKRVTVRVAFGRETIEREFGPGVTVAAVKRWAAGEFKMSEADATQHVLQIKNQDERPPAGTHIGTLASCPDCTVAFDLVPNERVQG